MKLTFSKMHGLGNDFMVVDGTKTSIVLSSKQIQRLSDRHRGVGFDQLLLIEASENPAADFCYRIFNADGSEVEQCGNGARCAAKFIHEQGLSQKKTLRLQTAKHIITLLLEDDGLVTVNMGQPLFEPADIPFIAEQQAPSHSVDVAGDVVTLAVVSMGNPHAVVLVDNVNIAPVRELGAKIEIHPAFPKRVNVGFMQVVDATHIKLRVFERGTGETQACGSGACAAVVSGIRLGLLNAQVNVNLPGGDLIIRWGGDTEPVWMTGPAEWVYDGVVSVN